MRHRRASSFFALFSAFSAFNGIDERVGWHKAQKLSEIVHEPGIFSFSDPEVYKPKYQGQDDGSKSKHGEQSGRGLRGNAVCFIEKDAENQNAKANEHTHDDEGNYVPSVAFL